ncbi:thiol-disulfide isomerase/thioredoxin [Catalinimonas alkaloidigena]|uniref:TlpA family protein disulfide reductase n=1 Tax=Catalinimonas alkaloidigena TaxID=1075417 RepID=UPI0024050160|nr:redoxin domain-containing protein [Catalinimonas alkaloidigena]MDF9795628.1 thiol-disulfide isomerase/thioredoxin [Catalinimonas alkaloidigena]
MRNTLYPGFVALMLLMVACNSSRQEEGGETSEQGNAPQEEQSGPLSKVVLKDLEGNAINLNDYAEKTIVLNFWATWCKPCIIEMPSMEEARATLGDEFVFLLASDESIEKISKFAERQNLELPFVQLQTGVQNLQITALPTTWIIKDGEVVSEIIGAREWNTEAHIEELKNL